MDNEEVIEWCAAQVQVLRRRMEQRFALLHEKMDAFRVKAARERAVAHESVLQNMLGRIEECSSLLQQQDSALASFQQSLVQQLLTAARLSTSFQFTHEHFLRAHGEALVL